MNRINRIRHPGDRDVVPARPAPILSARMAVSVLVLLFALSTRIRAADAATATGSVAGRVLDTAVGTYLNNARVSVAGTSIVTFTNEFGEYRLSQVPAGQANVVVSYTGMEPASATVSVAAGQVATRDFSLERAGAAQGVVRLDPYEVLAQKEMSAREIALNEQRYADNIKLVVSADEFGLVAQDNAGELLKYLPGVTIDQIGAEPSTVSVRGLPPDATPITQDGNAVASAVSSQKVGGELMDSRAVGLENISINNIARIEVTKSPTPDLRADSIGGTVNLVTRSAFERSRPVLNYRAYFNWNTAEELFEESRAGPSREARNHTYPAFNFSYIKPVNERFGFTLSGSHLSHFEPQVRSNAQRLPGVAGTPFTSFANPFLRSIVIITVPKTTSRTSFGGSADLRLGQNNTLSVVANYNYFDSFLVQSQYAAGVFNTSGALPPLDWGPNFTQSQPGAAGVNQFVNASRQQGTTVNLSTKFRHNGPVWKFDAGGFYSRGSQHRRDIDEGFFRASFLTLLNIGLRFENFHPETGMPSTIVGTTPSGAPLDWTRMEHYTIGTGTGAQTAESGDAQSQQGESSDAQKGAHFNLRRDFSLGHMAAPMTVRIGGDVRVMDRDVRDHWRTWTFVGPDGLRNSPDDRAGLYDLVNDGFVNSYEPPFGTPRFQSVSTYKYWELFQQHPEYFRFNPADSTTRTTMASKKLTETVPSAYIRADFRFFENRLKLVGGLRYEGTISEGEGYKDDLSATFQKDASGNLVRDAAGRPIRITADPETIAALRYTDRGVQAESKRHDYFPSLNATYSILSNLLARASYARTINRPPITNIVPGVIVSDPSVANPDNLLIRANNPDLKPWFADNYDLALEYYFGRNEASVISVGGFYKDITDFFGVTRTDATPQHLETFGLDDTYLLYDVQFLSNVGDAKVSGFDVSYRQALTFLPNWARGIEVFYNLTMQHLEGSTIADFRHFVRRTDNYGVTFSRPKFLVRIKVNDRGRIRQTEATGANMAPGSYRYLAPSRRIDVEAEYRITPRISLFAGGRNVTEEYTNAGEIYGQGTPPWGRPFQYWESGANWEFGVKGSF